MCELLKTRRSVRKYRPEQVPDELLDAVLEAGLYAPSAMNNQKPVMVAVRDKATRDQLSAMNAAVMGTDRDPFYGAPCVIVVLADPTYPTWVEDGSLVLGNLLDAAHGLLEGVEGLVRDEEVDASRADRLRQVAVVQIIDVHVLRAEHDADELLRRVDHLGVRL